MAQHGILLPGSWMLGLLIIAGVFDPNFAFTSLSCPKLNDSEEILMPIAANCSNFMRCRKDSEEVLPCPRGLKFDAVRKICDLPEKVLCQNYTSAKPYKRNAMQTCSQAKFSTLLILLPHESHCNQYYVCENGVPTERNCPSGLHFNRKKMVCDFPGEADCEISTSTAGYKIGVTVEHVDEATGFPSPFCPKINGKYPKFFQHTENCSIYYMCGNGIAYEFSCPSGLHFNLKKKVCDVPSRAGCYRALRDAITEAPVGIEHSDCPKEDPKIPILLQHQLDCGKFYICSNGMAYEKNCLKGLHFNKKLNVCDYPENAKCVQALRKLILESPVGIEHPDCPTKDPKTPIFLHHPEDCGKFYICSNGLAYEKTCLKGLHFSKKLNVCDYPENAKCANSNAPKNAKTLWNVMLESPVGIKHPDCPKKDPKTPIFLQHPEDCGKFYICSNGLAYEKTCLKGLHFNKKLDVCDYPVNAKCANSNAPKNAKTLLQYWKINSKSEK